MSEPMLKVSLRELTAVRLACTHCGSAVELVHARLAHAAPRFNCPGCNVALQDSSGDRNYLANLGKALEEAAHLPAGCRVEFLVPAAPERPASS